MADSIIFFLYIFAGSMGLVGIIQILMLAHFDNIGNRDLFRSMCLFMVCTAAIDFLYLGYDYYRLRVGHYDSTAILRILDIELFIFQPVFLCAYMRAKSHAPAEKDRELKKASDILAAVCASAGLITYGLMMEGYYESVSPVFAKAGIITEVFINASLIWLIFRHLAVVWGSIVQKETRILVTVIAISCSLNCLVNGILSVSILMEHYLSILEYELDMTPLFLFIISSAAVILLYREDFSALFRASGAAPVIVSIPERPEAVPGPEAAENAVASGITPALMPFTGSGESSGTGAGTEEESPAGREPEEVKKERLDLIAEEHFLTVREREVLELCYEGMTNPEIAEALYISMNTVKRHLHNIFEKLDVSTRIELIHLVNSKKLT